MRGDTSANLIDPPTRVCNPFPQTQARAVLASNRNGFGAMPRRIVTTVTVK